MQANVNKALTAVRKGQEQHAIYLAEVSKLRKGLPRRDREAGRAKLLPMVAKFYVVPVTEGAGKAKGTDVMNSEASGYEAARKALQRMVADIYGKPESSSKTDPVALLLASYKKLTAAQKRSFKSQL
jgi:hypothetical protein